MESHRAEIWFISFVEIEMQDTKDTHTQQLIDNQRERHREREQSLCARVRASERLYEASKRKV